jgi:nitroreductase
MEFYDVVRRRRSVRKFAASEIDEETLLRICDAGRMAPSGCNLQNREFVVIRSRETLAALHEKIQPAFQDAAAAIAVVVDPAGTKWGDYWMEDFSAAVENMLLAIVAEGYDSVWVEGTLMPQEDWAKDLLGVPAGKRLMVLLPIGKAAAAGTMSPKSDLKDLVHFEKYA